MAFTDKELKYIEDHKEEIDKGLGSDVNELEDLLNGARWRGSNRLEELLVFSLFGTKGFSAKGTKRTVSPMLEDVLMNFTAVKAKGIPFLPSTYRAKTSTVLYKVTNNLVEKSEKYQLSSKPELDAKLSEGYNLVTLDTKIAEDSVNRAFNGTYMYTVELKTSKEVEESARTYRELANVGVEGTEKEINTVIEKLKTMAKERLNKFFNNDFSDTIEAIVNSTFTNLTFDEVRD